MAKTLSLPERAKNWAQKHLIPVSAFYREACRGFEAGWKARAAADKLTQCERAVAVAGEQMRNAIMLKARHSDDWKKAFQNLHAAVSALEAARAKQASR